MKCLCYCVVCCSLMGNLLALDGNGFLENCQKYLNVTRKLAYEDGLADGVCLGYFRGVIETALIWQQGTKRQTFCLPEAAENDQLIRVTIKYLEDNPAQLHYTAAAFVQIALREAFPCIEGN